MLWVRIREVLAVVVVGGFSCVFSILFCCVWRFLLSFLLSFPLFSPYFKTKVGLVKGEDNLSGHILFWQKTFFQRSWNALQGLWGTQMGPLKCQAFVQNYSFPLTNQLRSGFGRQFTLTSHWIADLYRNFPIPVTSCAELKPPYNDICLME